MKKNQPRQRPPQRKTPNRRPAAPKPAQTPSGFVGFDMGGGFIGVSAEKSIRFFDEGRWWQIAADGSRRDLAQADYAEKCRRWAARRAEAGPEADDLCRAIHEATAAVAADPSALPSGPRVAWIGPDMLRALGVSDERLAEMIREGRAARVEIYDEIDRKGEEGDR